jgi:hypothetical protein
MDVFYTSSGEPDSALPAEAPDTAVALIDPSSATGDPCPTDAAAWRAWLERAGFSPAEATRLVFERLRPRDEGIQRNGA